MTIDAVFVNEDRHMHNVAVLMSQKGEFSYCPIFDNGAGLLSDTSMDYPLGTDLYDAFRKCGQKQSVAALKNKWMSQKMYVE